MAPFVVHLQHVLSSLPSRSLSLHVGEWRNGTREGRKERKAEKIVSTLRRRRRQIPSPFLSLRLLRRVSAHPWASQLLPPLHPPSLLFRSSLFCAANPNSQTAIITTCLKSYEFPNVCQEEQEGGKSRHGSAATRRRSARVSLR